MMHTDTRRIAKKSSKRTLAAIDDRIDRCYRFACSGIAINMMDIGRVFKEGRDVIAAAPGGITDEALCEKLRAFVQTIRKN
jgi:hypothetical protein